MKFFKNSIGKMLLLEMAIVIGTFLFLVLLSDAQIAYYIDMTSIVCIIIFTIPVLIASGMLKDFLAAFTIGKRECSLLQMKRSLEAVNMVQKLVLCSIIFTAVIELVSLLHHMTEIRVFGMNISVILLTVLYGLLMEFILIPLSSYIQNHITDAMNIEDEE